METFSKFTVHKKFAYIGTSYAASVSKDELQQRQNRQTQFSSTAEFAVQAAAIFSHSYSGVDVFSFVFFYL